MTQAGFAIALFWVGCSGSSVSNVSSLKEYKNFVGVDLIVHSDFACVWEHQNPNHYYILDNFFYFSDSPDSPEATVNEGEIAELFSYGQKYRKIIQLPKGSVVHVQSIQEKKFSTEMSGHYEISAICTVVIDDRKIKFSVEWDFVDPKGGYVNPYHGIRDTRPLKPKA
ncbi:MAG: hypothetical protein QM496_10665 [Verrucomicrobiota bacterium]